MELDNPEFHEAWEKLRTAGLLQPSRLAVLPSSSLQGLAELSVRGTDLPVDEMLKWLTEEREKAIPLHQIAQAEHVDYYMLHGYRLRLDEEKAKKETRIRHAQSEVQAVRMSRQEPPAWLGPASKLRRTDANDRKAGDQADREKWAQLSLKTLTEAGWIDKPNILGDVGVARMLLRLQKGMRVRTLRMRAESLQRISRWAKIANEGKWPCTTERIEDYMNDLSTHKRAGLTTFERARFAITYAEAAVGKEKEDRIGDSLSLKSTIKELMLRMAGKSSGVTKKSPQMITCILFRWEAYLLNEENPTYMRAYAWLKLICFWTVLRGEDSTWITPSSISWKSTSGLKASLSQTKTTGPSKKVRSREIFVAAKAFLIDESWLKVGWDLWKGSDDIRQNFIVLPTDDMEDFTNLSAIPADRAALTREILSIAGLQVNESEHDIKIINAASRFWTEHFSRATLVSMARALHVPKSVTDRMGWWSIGSEASEEYIRTYRSLIAKVQEKSPQR